MAVLRVHTIPGDDELLRRKAATVTKFDAALKKIAADMTETLPVAKGIGLAAPQVGHSIRMVLIDISGGEPNAPLPWEPKPAPKAASKKAAPAIDTPAIDGAEEALLDEEPMPSPPPFFLVNPVILRGEGTAGLAEGCLSVPGVRVEIPRRAVIEVEAQTIDGKSIRFEADDLLSIVIQHEMDHLEGRLIVDWAAQGCKMWREDEVPEDREILD